MFKVRFNDRKVVITFVAIVFLGKLSSGLFTAFGIFVYFGYLHLAILGMNHLVLFLPSLVYS